jgi:hypothetical protein
MEEIHNKIEQFFDEYEKRFAEGLAGQPDTEAIVNVFADFFVEASPVGVVGGKNDADFRETIPKGYDFYRSIGTTKMKINQLDIADLDDFHHMAEVYWEAFYDKEGNSQSIEFTVIYFLQHLNDQLKIFAYITGDEQKLLKEKGLIN